MKGLLATTVIVFIGTIAGQQNENACSKEQMDNGIKVAPHPEFCDLFLQCASGNKAVVRACPEGTLFDAVDRVCNHPSLAICKNNPREIDSKQRCAGGLYKTKCCNTYIACGKDSKKTLQMCSAGEIFTGKGCFPSGECEDNDLCPYKVRPAQTVFTSCRKMAVNDKCKYNEYLADGKTLVKRECSAGTAYNATACECTADSSCMPDSYLVNRVVDPSCRPSFTLEFKDIPISYTEKGEHGRQPNPHTIKVMGGYKPLGATAQFTEQSPNGEKNGLQIPYFAQNMIQGPFGIKITFQADANFQQQQIVLVGNGADVIKDCDSTLEIQAVGSGGQWRINVKAVGDETAMLSGTVSTYNGPSDVTVVLIYDSNTISAYASTPSTGRVDFGSAEVGELKNTACDLKVASGLVGNLKEFVIYEACGDIRRLNNLVSNNNGRINPLN